MSHSKAQFLTHRILTQLRRLQNEKYIYPASVCLSITSQSPDTRPFLPALERETQKLVYFGVSQSEAHGPPPAVTGMLTQCSFPVGALPQSAHYHAPGGESYTQNI